MKSTKYSITLLVILLANSLRAQDTTSNNPIKTPVYTFLINNVPEGFNYPLVGFINIAHGSHNSAHIGAVNNNKKNFKGLQTAFVNTTGGHLTGCQIGFLNNSGAWSKGAQIGFMNKSSNSTKGVQIGFMNHTKTSIKGSQIGFINTTAKVKGLQLGLINYTDTVAGGVPAGLLSIVKKGGYQAVESGVTAMYPVNLSYKIGIKKLYTTITGAYNPDLNNKFAAGLGFGSILPVSTAFFFNPELISQNTVSVHENQQMLSFAAQMGFSFANDRLQLIGGPSLTWNNTGASGKLHDEFYYLSKEKINNKNNLVTGIRLALRCQLTQN